MEVNKTSAVLSWRKPKTPNGPLDGYEIAIAPYQNEASEWVDVEKNSSTFEVSDLTAGAEYTVHIVAYNLAEDRQRLKSEIAVLHFSARE